MRFRLFAASLVLAPLVGAESEPPGLTVKTTSGTYAGLIDPTAPM